jgi:hypothetical protein
MLYPSDIARRIVDLHVSPSGTVDKAALEDAIRRGIRDAAEALLAQRNGYSLEATDVPPFVDEIVLWLSDNERDLAHMDYTDALGKLRAIRKDLARRYRRVAEEETKKPIAVRTVNLNACKTA